MSQGRKQIHLEMKGGKSNRQRMWEVIRAHSASFTAYTVTHKAGADESTVRTYLQSLVRGQYLEVVAGKRFEEQILRLVNDCGAEAPAVTREGKPSTAGKGTEAMWRTLRILGELDAAELAAQASIAAPTTVATAKAYLKWLARAEYVVLVSPSKPGLLARYRLARGANTGPRPPMIQRIGQVFDPNLGEVVYRHAAEVDE